MTPPLLSFLLPLAAAPLPPSPSLFHGLCSATRLPSTIASRSEVCQQFKINVRQNPFDEISCLLEFATMS
ncbi:hypothetical protein E2C01_100272 [Portunus trituberculatus]|uniref:Secreted protein n=1 Tax=Portunus trituberculatus TaxID=210409 RepID=A0A5B7KH44_PORTR|nr:hypothetical protein [Portunus trituberculatus]